MQEIQQIQRLKQRVAAFRQSNSAVQKIGFIPTMGFLHQGHLSLVEKAKAECGLVVMSIFVNPLQFGPNEDFDRYPRDLQRDLQLAEQAGVDIVFAPTVEEMYPNYPLKTKIMVADLTSRLCGASRPGHFDGVSTVVMKLFHIVEPDRAYFGMKDAQQVAVIQQMVQDLNLRLDVVPCPIYRETDGLAMSSRNVYLSAEERRQAVVLFHTLDLTAKWLKEETLTAGELLTRMKQNIQTAPLASLDYVELSRYPSLTEVDEDIQLSSLAGREDLLIALAVKFGNTRLIDNRLISLPLTREVVSHV